MTSEQKQLDDDLTLYLVAHVIDPWHYDLISDDDRPSNAAILSRLRDVWIEKKDLERKLEDVTKLAHEKAAEIDRLQKGNP